MIHFPVDDPLLRRRIKKGASVSYIVMNLKKKRNITFLLVAIPMGIALIFTTLSKYRTAFERQINASADSYIYSLSRSSENLLRSGNKSKINAYLSTFSRENPSIEYAYIGDKNSSALYHSFEGGAEFKGGADEAESMVDALFCRRFTHTLNNGMELSLCFKTTAYEIGYHSLAAFLIILFCVFLKCGVSAIGYVTDRGINLGLSEGMGLGNFGWGGNRGSGGGGLNLSRAVNPDMDYGQEYDRPDGFFDSFTGTAMTTQEKLEEDHQSLKLLHNMSQFLSHANDIHQVLEEFSQVLLSSMINTNCRIALIDETGTNLVIETDRSITDQNPYSQQGMSFPLQIVTNNSHIIGNEIIRVLRAGDLGDKFNAMEWEFFFPNELQSVLFIRLNARGRCLGYVLLGEKRHWERSPFNREKIEFCMTLVNQAIVAMECATLYKENHDIYLNAINSLTETLDARDPYTHAHSRGVTQYALLLAQSIGLSEQELEVINNAGLLHDIGKIAIPDYILHKPGKLTDMEFQLVKEHPIRGAKILEPIKEFQRLIPIVAHHHERYDGNGYHARLKEEDIPMGARIMAVADSFHAMTSDRPYRKGLSFETAIAELIRCRGSQFDPDMVDTFVNSVTSEEPTPQYA